MKYRPHSKSGDCEFYTPAQFIAAARLTMGGIWTRPAASWQTRSLAPARFTAKRTTGNETTVGHFDRFLRAADAVCIPTLKLRFWNPLNGVAGRNLAMATLIGYKGANLNLFCRKFAPLGVVMRVGPENRRYG